MNKKARKRPIKVMSIHYDGAYMADELIEFMQESTNELVHFDEKTADIIIEKTRGQIRLKPNNYLLYEFNTTRDFWAIDHNIYHKTYQRWGSDVFGNIVIKRPIEVEYFHFKDTDKSSVVSLLRFMNIKPESVLEYLQEDDWITDIQTQKFIEITTLEGRERLNLGEYLIKGIHGEFYPVIPEAFNQVYEKI